jgi:hypothetical protein
VEDTTVLRTLRIFALVAAAASADLPALAAGPYAWPTASVTGDTLQSRIAPPRGFERSPASPGSWADWLRGLPMKPAGSPVLTYTGAPKWRQDVHAAIVDMDVGKRDLQQCADAVMRLRAEWLLSAGRSADIAFNFTDGGRVPYARWARGERPSPSGKSWRASAKADTSYASFRRYLDQVYSYAGTYSLDRELKTVAPADIAIGDVFIKGGFPGHAVLVADMAVNQATGERRFLLLQSYMPAQEIHVLKNPAAGDGSPWYDAKFSWPFATPEWVFPEGSLKRWP